MIPRAYDGEQYISYHDESYLPGAVHLRGWAGSGRLHLEALTRRGESLAASLPKCYAPASEAVADERERMRRDGPLALVRELARVASDDGLHLLALLPYELAHVFDDLATDLPCLVEFQMCEMESLPARTLPWDQLPPRAVRPPLTLLEDTSPAFLPNFESARENLLAGDVFEIVLSRRFTLRAQAPLTESRSGASFEPSAGGDALFRFLAERTGQLRAPYRFALSFPRTRVVGASPELLVRVCAGKVIARPISGSLRREGDPGVAGLRDDERAAFDEILASEKEKSELDMLVDLARHDLHRVCDDVSVSDYREALALETVAHTQATVTGTLRDDRDAIDALLSCLNAGTLVGAPKRKAMELISELERSPRDYYGGNLVHLRPSGDLRSTILIRTAVLSGDEVRLQAGATVLVESDPRYEYWECGAKARGLLAMLDAQHLAFTDADATPPSVVRGTSIPPDRVRAHFSGSYTAAVRRHTGKRLLLVDNEDSFTFNLEALVKSFGCEIDVLRNRMPMPALSGYDGLVLSPGPSAPGDAGFLLEYVRRAAGTLPVLGVCLGFQAMVEALGGTLGRLAFPLHGKVRDVTRTRAGHAHPLLAGLPDTFAVARYHSLYAQSIPETLEIIASDAAGIPMALAARAPWPAFFGVQFHPESFLTGEAGVRLVSNWLDAFPSGKGERA